LLAHSDIPPDKLAAYLATNYRFGHGLDRITLRIDTRSEALKRLYASSGCACGAFLTAYNPMGQAHSLEVNEAAHACLVAELHALAIEVIEGAGADSSGAWPEEKSVFALGVELEVARTLGIRYRQDAIVWVGKDAIPILVVLR
jgi:Protein of unknown function (DUF3293)